MVKVKSINIKNLCLLGHSVILRGCFLLFTKNHSCLCPEEYITFWNWTQVDWLQRKHPRYYIITQIWIFNFFNLISRGSKTMSWFIRKNFEEDGVLGGRQPVWSWERNWWELMSCHIQDNKGKFTCRFGAMERKCSLSKLIKNKSLLSFW